jgi:hypothetical protein
MHGCWKTARRAVGTSVVIALSLVATAWGSEPAATAETRQTCADPQIEQPFLSLGDNRDYVLAPGGAFEDPSLTGWSLALGAGVDVGNEPFNVRGADDGHSLVLPPGASATSPTMCVDLNWPTMRFVAFQNGEKDAELDVEVAYPEAEGDGPKWHKAKSFKARNKDGWHATEDVKLSPERGGKKAGARQVALRFTNDSDRGNWRIDNVYVDPFRR